MTRNRLEDIGRIMVLIDNLIENPVFEMYEGRAKDFIDYFESMEHEKRIDFADDMYRGLRNVHEKLYDIYTICKGEDQLNERGDVSTL